jgi:enoyl-CoA hydratase/carnithine racemase
VVVLTGSGEKALCGADIAEFGFSVEGRAIGAQRQDILFNLSKT